MCNYVRCSVNQLFQKVLHGMSQAPRTLSPHLSAEARAQVVLPAKQHIARSGCGWRLCCVRLPRHMELNGEMEWPADGQEAA